VWLSLCPFSCKLTLARKRFCYCVDFHENSHLFENVLVTCRFSWKLTLVRKRFSHFADFHENSRLFENLFVIVPIFMKTHACPKKIFVTVPIFTKTHACSKSFSHCADIHKNSRLLENLSLYPFSWKLTLARKLFVTVDFVKTRARSKTFFL